MKENADGILAEAAKLIRRGWTQERYACDIDGVDCGPLDGVAASWCLTGALWRAIHDCGARREWDNPRSPLGGSIRGRINDGIERTAIGSCNDMVAYNDMEGMTAEKIAVLLEEA